MKPLVCPKWPEKMRLTTRAQAERTAARYSWERSKPTTVYECRLDDRGCGDFHLTTQGASIAEVLDGEGEEDLEEYEDEEGGDAVPMRPRTGRKFRRP